MVVVLVTTGSAPSTGLLDAPATAQTPGATGLAPLTPFDRCDSPGCSSQAYVRARLVSGLELVFCGHHGHDLAPALSAKGAVIRDDSHLLVEDRLRD